MKTFVGKTLEISFNKRRRNVATSAPNQDQIDGNLQIRSKEGDQTSKLLEWMKMNRNNREAHHLTFIEFPKDFVWNRRKKEWSKRKRNSAVGQMHLISSRAGEAHYLRILLTTRKGATSFEDLRTVNGMLYMTYQDACAAMGLLEDDNGT